MPFPAFVAAAIAIAIATVAAASLIRNRLLAAIAAITGAMAVIAVNAALYTRHYSDDAYITLRYARNFAAGNGPVWNPEERVEGYTDFAWMALLAVAHKGGADLVDASLWLSYASMLAVFFFAWRIWEMWSRAEASETLAHPATLAVMVLLIAFNDSIVFWGFSGLEPALAAALMLATAYFYMRERRNATSVPWSALTTALAIMTRPEMVALAAITGAFTLRDTIEDSGRRARLRLLGWLALFGAVYGAYFVWRWWYYGYFFPNTFYAKVGSGTEFINRGMGYVHAYGMTYLIVPFVIGAAILLVAATRDLRRDAQYVLAVTAAWTLAVIFEGGDAFAHGRFIAPLVPLIYIAGIAGWAIALERAIPDRRRLAPLAACAALLFALALARGSADPTLAADRRAHDERKVLGLWLKDNVPERYTVAVYAAGAVPYFAESRALDMLGLTDETIAHSDVPDFGKGIAGHEKYNIDYVLSEVQPELIMYGDTAPFVLPKSEILRLRGGLPAYNALIDDDRLWELYEPAAIEYEGRWFNFLQRKDIAATIRADWTETNGFVVAR